MSICLPEASAITNALLPYCPDGETKNFARWVGKQFTQKSFADLAALREELVSLISRYANERNLGELIVVIWQNCHAGTWSQRLSKLNPLEK